MQELGPGMTANSYPGVFAQVFEFLSSFMLWERQTNLVHEFYDAICNGTSEAQQMIMGDGKTTVVGPLLALMLGDRRESGSGSTGPT